VCGVCRVGKFMKRWKEWQHDSCPQCGTREDASHVWLCQGQDTNLLWDKALIGLHEWLMKIDTDPNITHLIITALTRWRNGDDVSGDSIFLQNSFERQELIGWQRFFEGWLTQEWARVQQSYYDLIHSRKTGRRWVTALIQKYGALLGICGSIPTGSFIVQARKWPWQPWERRGDSDI